MPIYMSIYCAAHAICYCFYRNLNNLFNLMCLFYVFILCIYARALMYHTYALSVI
jgi:hypothetical protein